MKKKLVVTLLTAVFASTSVLAASTYAKKSVPSVQRMSDEPCMGC